jgi:two-component system OmpR family sensor kinase
MEEGRKEYRFVSLDTSVWLGKLAADFEAETAVAGVDVITSIPDKLPPISADPEALGSAVRNLLDNAVKYSPDKKAVWLDAVAKGREVIIRVKDQGIGISLQEQPHIFDRFFRAEGEVSRRIKGAGLGLSLVKHIVTAHGGAVECRSQVNEGSTFSIRLPSGQITGGS